MKIIVGLGNPGEKYAYTRHNIGWLVLDALKQEFSKKTPRKTPSLGFKFRKKLTAEICKMGDLILAKPQTFMNNSGRSVNKLLTHFKVKFSDLWVIYDDLDLTLGTYKILKGRGPKDHKGLLSIYEKLGTKNFWHVRIGVDNRASGNRIPGEEYVLQNFTKNEMFSVKEVIKRVVEDLMDRVAGSR